MIIIFIYYIIIMNYIIICTKCYKYTENLIPDTNFCVNCNLIYIKDHPVYDLLQEELYENDT